jgi:hypothetical protein
MTMITDFSLERYSSHLAVVYIKRRGTEVGSGKLLLNRGPDARATVCIRHRHKGERSECRHYETNKIAERRDWRISRTTPVLAFFRSLQTKAAHQPRHVAQLQC